MFVQTIVFVFLPKNWGFFGIFCFAGLNLTNFATSLPKIHQIFNVKKLKENKKKKA
jgi:accessory gene regulator protein AgrB